MNDSDDAWDKISLQLKSMSLDELKKYQQSINIANYAINAGGVLTMLIMLINPGFFILSIGCIILYPLGTMGANMSKLQATVKHLLEVKDK